MVVYLVVVHENQDSRVTSVRPCFDFATADDISFFPAYSHLHFPVYCVVSRPFLRKATRDSSDDIFSLYSHYSHCVVRKPLKIPSIHRLRPNFERNLCQNKEVCCVLTEKLRNMFVLLCFDEKNWAGARMREKARACFENNHNEDFFV